MGRLKKSFLIVGLLSVMVTQSGCIFGLWRASRQGIPAYAVIATWESSFWGLITAVPSGIIGAAKGGVAGGLIGAGVGFLIGDTPVTEIPTLRVQSHDAQAKEAMGFTADEQVDRYNDSLDKLTQLHQDLATAVHDASNARSGELTKLASVQLVMKQMGQADEQSLVKEIAGDRLSVQTVENLSRARSIDKDVLQVFLSKTYDIAL